MCPKIKINKNKTCLYFSITTYSYMYMTDQTKAELIQLHRKEKFRICACQHYMLFLDSIGIVIPTFVLMILFILYLVSLTGSLRESNDDLKNQVRIFKLCF